MTTTWIIGASSGIGEALAFELARRGETLILSARNDKALTAIAGRLDGEGHRTLPLDITDAKAVTRAALEIAEVVGHVDRVLCFAGAYTPMKLGALDLKEVRQIIETNLLGAFNVTEAALTLLKAQGRGQIALCASVAGYRGLPNGQPYAATKAGVISLATSLRAEHGDGLDIKVINPGFVKTRLTDKNGFEMPMMVTPEQAAKAIADELDSKRFEIHFPKRFTLLAKLLSVLPDGLYFRAVKRMV
ncbi:SDR family NAD(P)-dependent oxidoreductase [Asticcacaulis sp. BYS171W]|uniref:SDR family NAD(P)-dependent oxidoreductase n=1 Tax=Asticcacaulis aquaticus TaxID=2984212 RepID=A0ABT5HUU9_9CAUL|nr:SDR family NAD(P)-dependent oxidoreductase [Asticcacaulis aquaticus]MDC7683852.1 SDR family NAD(P)-dependent oxidoreductase [Asticcacaulis aquaticus]